MNNIILVGHCGVGMLGISPKHEPCLAFWLHRMEHTTKDIIVVTCEDMLPQKMNLPTEQITLNKIISQLQIDTELAIATLADEVSSLYVLHNLKRIGRVSGNKSGILLSPFIIFTGSSHHERPRPPTAKSAPKGAFFS